MDIDDRYDKLDRNSREWPECCRRDVQAGGQEDALWPYIGDWEALQNGTVHRHLLNELLEQGIPLQEDQELPLEDPLARYKNVPLHARFLYTSMDPLVEPIILKHYATLRGLSRDRCDIYLSTKQFNDPTESLDYLEDSPILRESGVHIGYDDLPGIFFWDQQWEGEYVSFKACETEKEINDILRYVFQKIREESTIDSVRRMKQRLAEPDSFS